MKNECNRCRWFDADGTYGLRPDEGLCRFMAPSPRTHGEIAAIGPDEGASQADELMARSSYWPVVSVDDWCGQFAEAKA